VKLNWEIHGNTIPHLHAHLFPRYVGDRFEGRPIDAREVEPSAYDAGQFDRFATALQQQLGRAFYKSADVKGVVKKDPEA
jgi:diadenosine tetraphosphate (Ap4A) HIT family hydrolase